MTKLALGRRMPYTVSYSFDVFFNNINLSGDHRAKANTRKDDIVSKLESKFHILEAFSSGSIPKFTALSGRADLDVIVALHYGKHVSGKTPTQVLQSVRDALSQWRTGVRRNGQAVTLSYATWPDVDIVPVSITYRDDGTVAHYSVPNSNNGTWISSRPKDLSSAIDKKSTECGQNFRRIIKMVKHWNHIHGSYLSSYHIEVLALKILSGNLDDTPWHVHMFFDGAKELVKNSLWHDLGFADDYLSSNDRQEAQKRLASANDKSLTAWHHGYKDEQKPAIEAWRQLFGEKFPAYG